MIDDSTTLDHLTELDVPEELPSRVRAGRPRKGGAELSPHFNRLPKVSSRRVSEGERMAFRCAVKQPVPPEWMVKPSKPPVGKR
jgi:hypothetical protein